MLKQWLETVLTPLLNSKRANVGGLTGLAAVLVPILMTRYGMSEHLAMAVVAALGTVGGLFIHSQGNADQGKEAAKLALENVLKAKAAELVANGNMQDPKLRFALSILGQVLQEQAPAPAAAPQAAPVAPQAASAVPQAAPSPVAAPQAAPAAAPQAAPSPVAALVDLGKEASSAAPMVPQDLSVQARWMRWLANADPAIVSQVLGMLPPNVKQELAVLGLPADPAGQVKFLKSWSTQTEAFVGAMLTKIKTEGTLQAVLEAIQTVSKKPVEGSTGGAV
jgi:hypothetical protein